MAHVGRNDQCPCGSGRKAKRCCGVQRGPSEESLARAFLACASREAAWRLRRVSDEEFEGLLDELWELPAVDLSLQAHLPKLLSPELERLADVVRHDDHDPELEDPELLEDVARKIDTPLERARLARAVIAQAEGGLIDGHLEAAAVIDLDSGSLIFLCAALLEAVAVQVGVARTPGGILLAA
jgi:hypothetical protein